jgi:hypothetical protein
MSLNWAVFGACWYLQVTSIVNALRQRLARLRQPKYLFGAIVGGAYFYFLFFRRFLRADGGATAQSFAIQSPFALQIANISALALLIVVIAVWIVPSSRAALKFTEAEVAFLFPAPMTRRMLIHFKLLRSQLGLLFLSLFKALVSRRGNYLGGSP